MNAIEMAMKSMIDKTLANLPPEVLGTIGQIGQIAVSIKAQLDRIEARLIRIETAMNISSEPENDNEQRISEPQSPG